MPFLGGDEHCDNPMKMNDITHQSKIDAALGMILALHMGERGFACSRLHPHDGKCDIHCILHRVKKALYCTPKSLRLSGDAPLHDDLVLPLFYGHRNSYAFGYTAHLQIALHHILQAISGKSRGRKSNRRVLVNKQKILRTQVLIAFRVGGIEEAASMTKRTCEACNCLASATISPKTCEMCLQRLGQQ